MPPAQRRLLHASLSFASRKGNCVHPAWPGAFTCGLQPSAGDASAEPHASPARLDGLAATSLRRGPFQKRTEAYGSAEQESPCGLDRLLPRSPGNTATFPTYQEHASWSSQLLPYPIIRAKLQSHGACSSLPKLELRGLHVWARNPSKASRGLYGYEGLTSPEGFRLMADDAISRSEELIREAEKETNPLRVVSLLDDVSNTLCIVMDACELCRNTHPQRPYVDAAHAVFLRLSEYVQSLNSSPKLYSVLARAEAALSSLLDGKRRFRAGDSQLRSWGLSSTPVRARALGSTGGSLLAPPATAAAEAATAEDEEGPVSRDWAPWAGEEEVGVGLQQVAQEALQVARLLRLDFERGGVHLPQEDRKKVERLQCRISELGAQFCRNIDTDSSFVDIYPAHLLKPLPASIRGLLKAAPARGVGGRHPGTAAATGGSSQVSRQGEPGLRLPAVPSAISAAVLKWVPHEEVRRDAFMLANSSPASNLPVLDDLIRTRQELAKLLGFPSYANFVTAPLLAGSPATVDRFLVDLSSRVKAKAQEEQEMLLRHIQRHGGSPGPVAPWNHSFYIGSLKASECQIDSTAVAAYFPFSACVQGLAMVVDRLFGLRMDLAEASPGELWAPHVSKYTLASTKSDGGKEIVGEVYLDLHPRPGKFGHAAHFALRCGRWPGGSSSSCNSLKGVAPSKQIPAVALVCNFPSPPQGSGGQGPNLLFHSDVETLFHEFGHALHSLLSRTNFQHASGTRGSVDFVELPSHLLEYMVWDHRVLSQFARHHATGQPIPERLVSALRRSKAMFGARDIQMQLLYAFVDQQLFGERTADASSPLDTTSIVEELHSEHSFVPHVPGTFWQAKHSHLVGYGGAYYSYLYARGFASHLWAEYLERDPLDVAAGHTIWEEVLRHGGAKDPAEIVCRTAGAVRSPIGAAHGVGVMPDVSYLLKELKG